MPQLRIAACLTTVLFAHCLTTTPASSSDELAPPFKIAGKTSLKIQKYTGLTWLCEKSLGFTASLAARFAFGGHPNLRVRAYSFTDALSGKFKSLSVDLKDCSYRKFPLAHLRFETTTPLALRVFRTKNGAAGVTAPVMVAVSGNLTEKDVSKVLTSPEISSQLGFLRLNLPGLGDQHLQVLEPKVQIENGKVKIKTWLITANAAKETGVLLDISASPVLESQRFIVLKDTKVESKDINEPEQFSQFSQELLNPLLDFARFDRHTHAFRLTEFNLSEQNLNFAGKLLLAPKSVQTASLEKKPK